MGIKLRSLKAAGFRGFNEPIPHPLEFGEKITIIYGPNSRGKTTISEAIELLFYGETERVKDAAQKRLKSEYERSYQNKHYPEKEKAYITIDLLIDEKEAVWKMEIDEDENLTRYIEGEPVKEWPFEFNAPNVPYPFVLQHNLKRLIEAPPSERYQKFAALLGLGALEEIRGIFEDTTKNYKPPGEVKGLLNEAKTIEGAVQKYKELKIIGEAFKKASKGVELELTGVRAAARELPGLKREPEVRVIEAINTMIETRKKEVFEKEFVLPEKDPVLAANITKVKETNERLRSDEFKERLRRSRELAELEAMEEEDTFYRVTLNKLEKDVINCPVCANDITDIREEIILRIKGRLSELEKRKNEFNAIKADLKVLNTLTDEAISNLIRITNNAISRVEPFVIIKEDLNIVKKILGEVHGEAYEKLASLLHFYSEKTRNIRNQLSQYKRKRKAVSRALSTGSVLVELEPAIDALIKISECILEEIETLAAEIDETDAVLFDIKSEFDRKLVRHAGVEYLEVLKTLLSSEEKLATAHKINKIINSFEGLRATIRDFVGSKIQQKMSADFTENITTWYDQIKTKGDPLVHFAGFRVPTKKNGGHKRDLHILANTYGKELPSALAFLSESKLNALGLCINIGVNVQKDAFFSFLVIDDPIQSWDKEHEEQFKDVIMELINQAKQVILLSHNHSWVESLRKTMCSYNGTYYEINGYKKEGPVIELIPWADWESRLKSARAACKNPELSKDNIENAVASLRFVYCDLTALIYKKAKGIGKRSYRLTSEEVKKLLLESGVETALAERIRADFDTISKTHHDHPEYTPDREQLSLFIDHAWNLAKYLKP